jgi:hypothetical protein
MQVSRKTQRGYLDGLFPAIVVVCIAIGIVAAYVAPWLWSLLKPLIHALTA